MKELNTHKIQNQLRNKFLRSGIKMIGPETIFFSKDTKIGKNVTIEPYVVIGAKVKIGNNVTIKSFFTTNWADICTVDKRKPTTTNSSSELEKF